MSRDIQVDIQVGETQVPVGPAPSHIVVTLIAQGSTGDTQFPPQNIPAEGPYTTTFKAAPAGTYVVSAQLVNVDGGNIGSPIQSTPTAVADAAPATMAVQMPVIISLSAV